MALDRTCLTPKSKKSRAMPGFFVLLSAPAFVDDVPQVVMVRTTDTCKLCPGFIVVAVHGFQRFATSGQQRIKVLRRHRLQPQLLVVKSGV